MWNGVHREHSIYIRELFGKSMILSTQSARWAFFFNATVWTYYRRFLFHKDLVWFFSATVQCWVRCIKGVPISGLAWIYWIILESFNPFKSQKSHSPGKTGKLGDYPRLLKDCSGAFRCTRFARFALPLWFLNIGCQLDCVPFRLFLDTLDALLLFCSSVFAVVHVLIMRKSIRVNKQWCRTHCLGQGKGISSSPAVSGLVMCVFKGVLRRDYKSASV